MALSMTSRALLGRVVGRRVFAQPEQLRQHFVVRPFSRLASRRSCAPLTLPAQHGHSCRVASFSTKSSDDSEKEDEPAAEAEAEEEAAAEGEEEQDPMAALEAKVKALEAERDQKHDQVLRALAETENVRRIAQKDVVKAREYAVQGFAKGLLDVADNLSRAMDAVPEEALKGDDANASLVSLMEGVSMTEAQLMKTFNAHGVVKFGDSGDVFDPNLHEAMFQYPDPDMEPNLVGQVLKTGFKLKDRVIRPAQVGVTKAP